MAEKRARLRLAMGVFDDLARLTSAAGALIAIGLDPLDLCFAAGPSAASPEDGGAWLLAERTPRMSWFQYGAPAASRSAWFALEAEGLITNALGAALTARPHRSPASDVWRMIDLNLGRGALLLVARMPSPALQDRAVRALLQYSQYPVHAEEFLSSA